MPSPIGAGPLAESHQFRDIDLDPFRAEFGAVGTALGVAVAALCGEMERLLEYLPIEPEPNGSLIPARYVVKHPANISFEEAAASWMHYVTAWGALVEQAKLKAEDFVIVSAASSSVGIAAFQVARSVGATVIATTRTGAKRQALLDAGAHHVIATAEEDLPARVEEITGGKGARVVFDPIGGPAIAQLAECMAVGGILLEYGALSSDTGPFPQFAVLGKSLTLKGYLYTEIVSDDAILDRAKAFINEGLQSGTLHPLIARTFPFNRIKEATEFLESNEQIGKIVVTLG